MIERSRVQIPAEAREEFYSVSKALVFLMVLYESSYG